MAETAQVVDPTAAANGVASLPIALEQGDSVAAYTTPFHSVTGAIMRRSMRIADLFEENPDALDALLDFLAGVNAYMIHARASGREVTLDVKSTLVPAGGGMKLVTVLRNQNDEQVFDDLETGDTVIMNDGPAAEIVTSFRRK